MIDTPEQRGNRIGARWTWVLDFVILGVGTGLLAPLVMLIPMGSGLYVLAIPVAVGGGLLGVLVGSALHGLASWAHDRPIALFGLGFPVGTLAGATCGYAVGSFLDFAVLVGSMGAVTGGLVLGVVWLPYLALRLRQKSGLVVIVPAVLLSPLAGGVAVLMMFQLF